MDIKLIIWDLDDTLWHGTLAEGDDIILNEGYVSIVKALNLRGVVSSICSKNDEAEARTMLIHHELWDQFVFPYINFSPKGEAVSEIIKKMQLRASNVLFVDDNVNNLAEVKQKEPEINVADARSPTTLSILQGLVLRYEGIRKSRIGKYRALEARHNEWQKNTGSREDFLRSCEITMAIAERTDNSDFVSRIEELINRTNQMNFTKSRVCLGTLHEPILLNGNIRSYSVFVWDKYGYHGLVGFAMIEDGTNLRHFCFSCRIMHMGIEQRVLHELSQHYDHKGLDISNIPVTPAACDWIQYVRYADPDVRNKILAKETNKCFDSCEIRVMANCQSAALAHFGGFSDRADADIWPRVFNLQTFAMGIPPLMHERNPPYNDHFPSLIVYGAFNDYFNESWSTVHTSRLELGIYEECAKKFSDFIKKTNRKAMIILPPSKKQFVGPGMLERGITVNRIRKFNSVWRDLGFYNENLRLVQVGVDAKHDQIIGEDHEFSDFAHFRPSLLKRIGAYISSWLTETSNNQQ